MPIGDQVHHPVREHLRVHPELVLAEQPREHRVGDGADAHLQRGAVLDQRRTVAPVQWQDLETVADRLQAPGDARDTAIDLERCLQQLPAEQRAVLLLVTLEDMDYAEVARVLQVPVGTVMSRLSRARARLKELMDMTPTPPRVPSEMPRVALHRLK